LLKVNVGSASFVLKNVLQGQLPVNYGIPGWTGMIFSIRSNAEPCAGSWGIK